MQASKEEFPLLGGVIRSIDAFAECFRYDDASSGTTVRRWYKALGNLF